MSTDLLHHPQFKHAVHTLENLRDWLGDTAVHVASMGAPGVPRPPAPSFLSFLTDSRRSDADAPCSRSWRPRRPSN